MSVKGKICKGVLISSIIGSLGFLACSLGTMVAKNVYYSKAYSLVQETEVFKGIYRSETKNQQMILDEAEAKYQKAKDEVQTGECSVSDYQIAKSNYDTAIKTYEDSTKYYRSDEFCKTIIEDFASPEDACVKQYDYACYLNSPVTLSLALTSLAFLSVSIGSYPVARKLEREGEL